MCCAQGIGVGYLDLDLLYDTIPSPFYDDSRFTPEGKNHWTTERYQRKIENSAAIIDSMSLPIVGLYGIENEAVVRDLVKSSDGDYQYLHRTRNSLDGLDFALLYQGDRLQIEQVEALRRMIIIDALLLDEGLEIRIILSINGDDLVEYVKDNPTKRALIVMGAISANHLAQLDLADPLFEAANRGFGNRYSQRSGWWLGDRIGVSRALKILKSGVYLAPWLLDQSQSSPLPTFNKQSYIGGYGNYLPIFLFLI